MRLSRGLPAELPRGQPTDGNSKLHTACLNGNLSAVRKHLKPAELNRGNKWQRTPLHEACRAGQEEVVSFLLLSRNSNPFDIDARDYRVCFAVEEEEERELCQDS